mgnify:CR=1 FL=1
MARRRGLPVVVTNVHEHPMFEPLRLLWAEAGLDVAELNKLLKR